MYSWQQNVHSKSRRRARHLPRTMRITVSRFLASWWCAVEDSIHKSKQKHLRATKHIIMTTQSHTDLLSESAHRLKQTLQWIVSQAMKCALQFVISFRASCCVIIYSLFIKIRHNTTISRSRHRLAQTHLGVELDIVVLWRILIKKLLYNYLEK
jgi:hypothetical protein